MVIPSSALIIASFHALPYLEILVFPWLPALILDADLTRAS
jgi:TRAP-type uncharacterized transport system fused permease subunit